MNQRFQHLSWNRSTISILLLCSVVSLPALSPAQTLKQYLAMRKKAGIVQAVGIHALGGVLGKRTLELQGTVSGTYSSNGQTAIVLAAPNGESQVIDSPNAPDWLSSGEVAIRALVVVQRESSESPLTVRLLGAAPEAEIQPVEQSYWSRQRAIRDKHALRKQQAASRKGSRRGIPQLGHTRVPRDWSLPASQVTPIYARFIRKQNPRLPGDEAMRIAQGVVGFSLHYGVDARLVMAILMVESGFDPTSTSRSGAMGLGQLMPDTARWMGVNDAYDTIDNLYGCVKLLRTHLDEYHRQTGNNFDSLVLTLAAYNAGEGAVRRHGGVPPYRETQAYVRRVIDIYYRLAGG